MTAAVAQNIQGAEWLNAIREASAQRFSEQGLPTRKTEHWRYTPTTLIEQGEFVAADAHHEVASELLADIPAPRAVLVNGCYDHELSDLAGMDAAFICDTATAIAEHVEQINAYLAQADLSEHPFAEQNTAHFTDGVVAIVGDGVQIDAPLHIVNVVTAENNLTQQRNVLALGEKAKLDVIEYSLATSGDAYFNNIVTEVHLADSAELTQHKLQQEGGRGLQVSMTHVNQQRSSIYRHFNFDMGGRLVRNDIIVELNAPQAHCDLQGLATLSGRQHVDNHTWIHHNVEDCTSNEYYKAILDGKSHSVFNGYVKVARDAQRTDSNQQNKNLLLSRDAEVDTKPELEIYADDVKCAHGATIGELDETALFYLRSRGIPEAKAMALLTYAFASEIVDHAPDDSVRERVMCALSTKLDDHGIIREMIR